MSFWLLTAGLGMGAGDEVSLANSHLHALPYPIYGARWTVVIPYLDADGDPTDPVTPDTEIKRDAEADWTDTETNVTLDGNGEATLTLSGVEMQCNIARIVAKAASGPKSTLANVYPKRLPKAVPSTTLSAVTASGGTLASPTRCEIAGCFIRTAAPGDLARFNEARRITSYDSDTGDFEVEPEWDNTASVVVEDRAVDILAPEGVTVGMILALNPTVPGNRLNVSLTGGASTNQAAIENQSATVNLEGTRVRLHADYDLYHADLHFCRDQANTRDEYTVVWFFDGQPLTTGVTSPTLQLILRSDGTDLLAATALTQIGSTGYFKHDESVDRVIFGEAVIPVLKATIHGTERTFIKLKGLDSV